MNDTKTAALVAEVERLRSEDSAELSLAHKTIALQGDEIERLNECLRYQQRQVERLTAQRDELLTFVQTLPKSLNNMYPSKSPTISYGDRAKRLIAAMRRTDAGAVT